MSETEAKMSLNPESRQIAFPQNNIDSKREDDEHDWWASETGSSTDSYYTDTESYIAEWELEVSSSGEVFYIESLPDSLINNEETSEDKNQFQPSQFTRRRSTRAEKLVRLIKRRESNRCSIKNKNVEKIQETENKNLSTKKFPMGEIYEVMLSIDPEKRHNLGRRASMCETYLGIIPKISSQNKKIIVSGFIPDGEAVKNQIIKKGDYLCSINSRNVTFENLDAVLSNITASMNVILEFQRVTNDERTEKLSIINPPKQSSLVRQLVDQNISESSLKNFLKYPIGVMFLKTTGLVESRPEPQDILYAFPCLEDKMEQTVLFSTRGAFVTLNHMLMDILGPRPISSTIRFMDEKVHITYTVQDDNLLLIALPDSCCNEYQAAEIAADVVRILEFTYGTLTKCFTSLENHPSLDHLFFLFYQRILLKMVCTDNIDLLHSNKNIDYISQVCEFETILPAAQSIRLSRDAQIQIDAALNEMEAMDYRDWNEDPMDCQRLYTILGSCLYHKNYLLESHLPHNNLIQVHSFMRHYGLLNLVSKESVKCLIIWKKVYPMVFKQEITGTLNQSSLLQSQWFLLIVGYKQDLLAVLLESGGCTAKFEENVGPDVFYVEEAQETLKHIQKIGISTLAAKWILANSRPEVILSEEQQTVKSTTSIAENWLGFIKSSETQSLSSKSSDFFSNKKTLEVTSTSKRLTSDENTVASGSVYSLQTSEDSLSQGTGAVSEMSDEAAPILGRRAIRERINVISKYSDDSDSDLDIYKNNRQMNNMDISEIRDHLLNQAEYIAPKVLTSGNKNYLIHYVHLDLFEGVLISSTIDRYSIKNSELLSKFSRFAYVIHRLLQNTVRYKKMLNQNMDKSVINKSLVAIKEHGLLFEWDNKTYWVVGRMYSNPQAKEVYVCYQDTVPQNLVEMTFRLNSMN